MHQAQFVLPDRYWLRRGQRPEGTPAPTAAQDAVAQSRAVAITTGARIHGQVSKGALSFSQPEMQPLRFLLEGAVAALYELQLLMLCIGLWMLALEAQELGERAVGLWRALVTEDLDAAENIIPGMPLGDMVDELQTRNLLRVARGLLLHLEQRGVDVEIVCTAGGISDATRNRVDSLCSTIDPFIPSSYNYKLDCSRLDQECAAEDLKSLIRMKPPLRKFWQIPALQDLSLSGTTAG